MDSCQGRFIVCRMTNASEIPGRAGIKRLDITCTCNIPEIVRLLYLCTILAQFSPCLPYAVSCIHFWFTSECFVHTAWLQGKAGLLPEKLTEVCGPLPKTLTLFMTKSLIFPTLFVTRLKIWYPIYGLTLKLIRGTLLQTCFIISYPVQSNVKVTVEPVLRDHSMGMAKWLLNTGWLPYTGSKKNGSNTISA